ncbi:hypothetical protein GF354_00935 [Candidatus Peregrinibacteria bacterium]|nr:hypothetical protein [Candidatus Peregrinibacteria bacterium]
MKKLNILNTRVRPLSAVESDCKNNLPISTCWVNESMTSEPKHVVFTPRNFISLEGGFSFEGKLISPLSLEKGQFPEGTEIIGEVRQGIESVIYFVD